MVDELNPDVLLSQDDIKKIIGDNKDAIKKTIETTIADTVIEQLTWKLKYEVEEVVNTFFDEEIKPEIKTILLQNKDAIIEEVSKASIEVASLITAEIVKKATKNMTTYSGGEILRKLFA